MGLVILDDLQVVFSHARNIVRALPALFLLQFELHVISLNQHIAKAGVLHITLMEKYLFTLFRCDESKPFGWVEKLHCSLNHTFILS